MTGSSGRFLISCLREDPGQNPVSNLHELSTGGLYQKGMLAKWHKYHPQSLICGTQNIVWHDYLLAWFKNESAKQGWLPAWKPIKGVWWFQSSRRARVTGSSSSCRIQLLPWVLSSMALWVFLIVVLLETLSKVVYNPWLSLLFAHSNWMHFVGNWKPIAVASATIRSLSQAKGEPLLPNCAIDKS